MKVAWLEMHSVAAASSRDQARDSEYPACWSVGPESAHRVTGNLCTESSAVVLPYAVVGP